MSLKCWFFGCDYDHEYYRCWRCGGDVCESPWMMIPLWSRIRVALRYWRCRIYRRCVHCESGRWFAKADEAFACRECKEVAEAIHDLDDSVLPF
jgi:hypothetical protein